MWRVIQSAKVLQSTSDPCKTAILAGGKITEVPEEKVFIINVSKPDSYTRGEPTSDKDYAAIKAAIAAGKVPVCIVSEYKTPSAIKPRMLVWDGIMPADDDYFRFYSIMADRTDILEYTPRNYRYVDIVIYNKEKISQNRDSVGHESVTLVKADTSNTLYNCTGEYPTAAEFNALLDVLRERRLLSTRTTP